MNLSQRKRHFIFWWVLALIIPFGFFFAVSAIPSPPSPAYPPGTSKKPLSHIVQAHDIKGFQVNFRAPNTYSSTRQLEIVVKSSLQNPSTEVFLEGNSPDSPLLLGLLGPPGVYRFTLPDSLVKSARRIYFTDGHIHTIDLPK